MSNSSLVTYRHITKHKNSGRGGHKIEKIFVHHMAGCLTVKQCGSVFDNRQASAHYGVNGSAIGQYVDEKDTAWHCGNFSWNQRSIGIELANDAGAKGMWHVSDDTISTAIKLIADICKRNDIPYLNYTGDMNGNLCMHRWVCSTSCPGPYLSNQFARIAKGVNDILGGKAAPLVLEEDGIGGPMTVSRMQEFLGTPIDGVISGQNKSMAKYYPALKSVIFDDTESTCVHALQWMVGVYEDGVLGPDTIKAWQKFLGVKIDGSFGTASMKAWQKYLNEHKKAVFPATHVTKPVVVKKPTAKTSAPSVSTPKASDIPKWVENANAWAKKIAADNSWHYVKWSSDKRTHECPICHKHPKGKYHGWNCIGFGYAVWHHGGGLKNNCNCHIIANDTGEKMYKASLDDATKIAKKFIGLNDIKVIRNKKGIPKSEWKPGDMCMRFSGSTYTHTFYYMGNGLIADSTGSNGKVANNKQIAIRSYKKYSAKIIIRYTGK